jgi:hypothetical protein
MIAGGCVMQKPGMSARSAGAAPGHIPNGYCRTRRPTWHSRYRSAAICGREWQRIRLRITMQPSPSGFSEYISTMRALASDETRNRSEQDIAIHWIAMDRRGPELHHGS